MDFHTIVGYVSGLYFIKPDLEPSSLLRTASLVHAVDAFLSRLIAAQSGRNKNAWTAAGFILGIWALGVLLLLPGKKKSPNENSG